MIPSHPLRTGRRWAGALVLALLTGAAVGSGCGSMRGLSRRERIEKSVEQDPRYTIKGIQGPTERSLAQTTWHRKREELEKYGDEETQAALAKYDAAQAMYDEGKFPEAEKAFKELAKERKGKHDTFWAKVRRAWGLKDHDKEDMYATFGDAIEEDAIFMRAESQFAQQHYAHAQESYEDLLTRYPSTRHLDQVTRQLFRIARYWLDFPDNVGETGDAGIQLASKEEDVDRPKDPEKKPSSLSRVPVLPNLTDKTRPLFDTYGRGEQALKSIWLHDATGPLADDALMLAANHNLRTEDFPEARRLYQLLREQYPDSPHLKDAYLLGSAVSLASYQGPAYDGQTLTEARELKQGMLQIFPDITPEQREQLQAEISKLKEAEVDRFWDLVDFYRAKRNPGAMKLHCYLIINKFPDSIYAEKARKTLIALQEQEVARQNSLWNRMWREEPPEPLQPADPQKPEGKLALPDVEPEPAPPETPKPSPLQRLNPLRRAPQPPQLQPVEQPAEEKQEDSPESKSAAPPGRMFLGG